MSIFNFSKKDKKTEDDSSNFTRSKSNSNNTLKRPYTAINDNFDELNTKTIMKNVSAVNNYGYTFDKNQEKENNTNNKNFTNKILSKNNDSDNLSTKIFSIEDKINEIEKLLGISESTNTNKIRNNNLNKSFNRSAFDDNDLMITNEDFNEVDLVPNNNLSLEIKNTENKISNENKISTESKLNVKNNLEKSIFSTTKKTIEEKINEAVNNILSTNLIEEKQEVKEKKEENSKEKNNTEEKEFSTIMSLALSRPIETAYDLKDRYEKEPFERLDLHANNQDLISYVSKRIASRYLDVSNCQSITDFSIIGKMLNLEELDLSGISNLKDLSFLSNLKNLRVLNLGTTGIESLENFPKLPKLEVLNLKMNRIRNLNGLESCPNIHELILWGCTSLDNIDILKDFTEIRALDLDSCNVLRNINPIVNMTKLVYLNLNFTRIEDLRPIKNLTNLEIFTMDFCPLALSEQNLSCFDNLVKMKFLGLRNRLIRSLSHFKNMTEMAELELSGNAINDLSPLENMTKLEILNLSTNPSLTDLSPLHKMKKLKKLMISGAKSGKTITVAMLIEDISVIKELENLEVFESNFNKKLRDISPLQYCKKLEEVDLNDCFGISDVTPLRFCKNLKEIYLENCTQIRDLSFVKYLKKLKKITLAKTSADRLLISDWTTLLELKDLKDGDGTLPIHKAIINGVKFRKKISKIAKKAIKKEED